MLTAGFRWAPETLPMNRMIAITIRPGATTAAVRLMTPGKALAHHSAAGRDNHEQECAVQLREQAPPFLARIIEVLNSLQDVLLRCAQLAGDEVATSLVLVSIAAPGRALALIFRHGSQPPQVLAYVVRPPQRGPPPQNPNVPLPKLVVIAVVLAASGSGRAAGLDPSATRGGSGLISICGACDTISHAGRIARHRTESTERRQRRQRR